MFFFEYFCDVFEVEVVFCGCGVGGYVDVFWVVEVMLCMRFLGVVWLVGM